MSVKSWRQTIDVLKRRREHLAERVGQAPRDQFSFDRSELAALTRVIRVLENALAVDALAELEAYVPSWSVDP